MSETSKTGHRPPDLICGFSLDDDVSGAGHLECMAGVSNPEEAFTARDFDLAVMRTVKRLENLKCLLRRVHLCCYSKTGVARSWKISSGKDAAMVP